MLNNTIVGFQTEEDLVMSCNVMIFVLTDTSLADPFCVHQVKHFLKKVFFLNDFS